MKRMILLPALLLAFLMQGCVNYNEWLTLNKDGSGTIKMRVAIDEELRAQMKSTMEQFSSSMGDAMEMPDPMAGMNEKDIKTKLAERKSGARLKSFSRKSSGGDEVTEMEFSFQSMADFEDMAYALDSEDDEDASVPFTYAKGGDGLWLYTRDLDPETMSSGAGMPEYAGMDAGMSEGSSAPAGMPEGMPKIPGMGDFDPSKLASMSEAEREAAMEKMMSDLQSGLEDLEKNMGNLEKQATSLEATMEQSLEGRSMRFEVTFPGKIVESNATRIEGNTAIWEFPLNEMKDGTIDSFSAKVKQ
ncbi:MAG: hypothetical protein HKN20_00715 [Gemmatimonadetes bacterium]|nr:hypothetical protein [Gemmatimonadota bacterium]